jgi:hypothetical protein
MADDAASAMNTLRSKLMDRAFEAVEGVAVSPEQNIEAFVVIIAADVTLSHLVPHRALLRVGACLECPHDSRAAIVAVHSESPE